MNRFHFALALALGCLAPVGFALERSTTSAQQVLDLSARQGQYTFLLFYKDDNAATRTMAQTLKAGIARHDGQAAMCLVSVANPADQAVIKRFGATRAPMPFALAVAPNGAITGLYSQKLSEANFERSFVTEKMAECMKALQEKKLVLVSVRAAGRDELPAAVGEFMNDADFQNRLAVISVAAGDPAEVEFLKQMEIDPAQVKTSSMVFLAPPAVLVGKFSANASMAEMAAALHKAGKCCDDPNCKHNHGPQVTKQPNAARK